MLRFISFVIGIVVATQLTAPLQAQVPYSWGLNNYGQLGNGTTTNSNVPVPVYAGGVLSGQTITAITGGGTFSLALANGFVYAWGHNNDGELGNNSTSDSSLPVAVSTAGVLSGRTVTAIAGGAYHSLALANGQVYAWGYNVNGQLGNGTTASSNVPVAVSTAGVLSGLSVTAISAGGSHNVALANGQVYAWGYNGQGALGNNSYVNSNVPVAVSTAGVLSGQTVTAIAAGGSHNVALANGQVYAWGLGTSGQLGNNLMTSSNVPVAVSTTGVLNGLSVTAISAGLAHSLAIADGHVYTWGYNSSGQLGNNSRVNSYVPVAVSSTVLNSLNVVKIAGGNSSSYAITDHGRLFAWGDNANGELGLGSTATNFTTPQEVFAPSGFTFSDITVGPTSGHVVLTFIPVPEPGSVLLVLATAAGSWRLRRRLTG